MKTMKSLIMVVTIGIGLFLAGSAQAQTAQLQVIHNAADPNAAVVDIYVNEALFLDDFAFRAATPFVEVPAEVTLAIGVAPGSSSGPEDILATFAVTLGANERYVVVANGVLDPGAFAGNPEGASTAFSLYPLAGVRESALYGQRVELIAFHGATDAPRVDILRRSDWGGLRLFSDVGYGEFSSARWLPADAYVLDVTPAGQNETVVASFSANLSGLNNGVAVVFASGFLDPDANQGGAAFGLFAALADGQVVALPAADATARLQVIHNAADLNAASVDVYVNDGLFLDDFAFRTATPFVDVPAGVELTIGVAPGGSSGPEDIIAEFPVILAVGGKYVAIANGVLNPGDYAPNPDGAAIGFNLFARPDIREEGNGGSFVRLIAFHGATDAPAVDLLRRSLNGSQILFDDLSYGQFSDYRFLWAETQVIDVTPANDNQTVVASFEADLAVLRGGVATVFASGFLDPDANQGGAAFGLFAALPDGRVLELQPLASTAQLQVIHNAADPAAEIVDVYVNDGLFLDDFAFRTATPFVEVPAGVTLTIGVAPGSSGGPEDVIADFDVTLTAGETYIAVANGVLTPDDFAANPGGASIAFSLYPRGGIQQTAWLPTNVRLIAFHGATDAPGVDILRRTALDSRQVFSDLAYGDFAGYRSLQATSYILDITPADDNQTVVASYAADLSAFGGTAAIVFASGFLNPDANQGGPAFGLFVALRDGSVIALPAYSDVAGGGSDAKTRDSALALSEFASPFEMRGDRPLRFALGQSAPNPVRPFGRIAFALPQESQVSVKLYAPDGRVVQTLADGRFKAGVHEVRVDATDLASGTYFYRMTADSFRDTKRLTVIR